MKKHVIIVVGVTLVLAVAWAAFGQPTTEGQGPGGPGGPGGGFGRTREVQTKAIAAIQEQLGKLKTLMEQAPQGRPPEGASDEEMAKMREERTKRREEQQKIIASMQQEMDKIRGGRELATEHTASLSPLKELQASAEKENAKETAKKIGELISQRQKQFQDKMAALGYAPEEIERAMQPRSRPQ